MAGQTTANAIRRALGSETVIRIADAIGAHPRFDRLFVNLPTLYAWSDRAVLHYVAEVDRIGPTKARQQLCRIVNDVALVGA